MPGTDTNGASEANQIPEQGSRGSGILGGAQHGGQSSRRDSERLIVAKLLTPKHSGVYLPGIRDEIRQWHEREVLRGDPRLLADFAPDMTSEQRRRANAASPVIRQAEHTLARMDAGEDIETGRPSAHDWPELAAASWYADPSVRRVVVSADDTVRPIYD